MIFEKMVKRIHLFPENQKKSLKWGIYKNRLQKGEC